MALWCHPFSCLLGDANSASLRLAGAENGPCRPEVTPLHGQQPKSPRRLTTSSFCFPPFSHLHAYLCVPLMSSSGKGQWCRHNIIAYRLREAQLKIKSAVLHNRRGNHLGVFQICGWKYQGCLFSVFQVNSVKFCPLGNLSDLVLNE